MNKDCHECGGKCCQYIVAGTYHDPSEAAIMMMREGVIMGECYTLIPCKCKHQKANGACGTYESRPQVCRDFSVGSPLCSAVRNPNQNAVHS